MTETLLSASNVILFGRRMADIKIVVPREEYRGSGRRFQADFGATSDVALDDGPEEIDGITIYVGNTILLVGQSPDHENGLYEVSEITGGKRMLKRVAGADSDEDFKRRIVVTVSIGEEPYMDGSTFVSDPVASDFELGTTKIELKRPSRNRRHSPFVADRAKGNRQLEQQLLRKHQPAFARIYGFSYDGRYYELPNPTIFLVHGAGELASGTNSDTQDPNFAKAPGDPSISGMSAADFQFSDELRAWSYDRADYTIRMDMESGMLEQVLLEPHFGGGMGLSGAKLSGAKVSGAKVSGAKVSGAKVSGAKLSGASD